MVSIQLRELRQTDWQAVHRYASLEIVSRYQPWGPNSEEETRQYVDEVLRDAARKTGRVLPLPSFWKVS